MRPLRRGRDVDEMKSDSSKKEASARRASAEAARGNDDDGAAQHPRGSGTGERILDAAEVVFAESGFAGASVRDIAARAGLNAASLYNYYPGKQELYEAVLDRALTPIFEMLGGLTGQVGGNQANLDAIDTVVDHIAARPAIARMLHYEALAGGESIARLVGRWIAPIYGRAVAALRASPADSAWSDAELPLLIESFHNVIVGYFSMAPLMERILGEDPLSPKQMTAHKAFLKKFVARLVNPVE